MLGTVGLLLRLRVYRLLARRYSYIYISSWKVRRRLTAQRHTSTSGAVDIAYSNVARKKNTFDNIQGRARDCAAGHFEIYYIAAAAAAARPST